MRGLQVHESSSLIWRALSATKAAMENAFNFNCQQPSDSLTEMSAAKADWKQHVSEKSKEADDEAALSNDMSQTTTCPATLPSPQSEYAKAKTPDKQPEQQMPMTHCSKPQGKRQLVLQTSSEIACDTEAVDEQLTADARAYKLQKHSSTADANVLQPEAALPTTNSSISDQSSYFIDAERISLISETHQQGKDGEMQGDVHFEASRKASPCLSGLEAVLTFETLLSLAPSSVGCTLLSFLTPAETADMAVASSAGAVLLRSMLSDPAETSFKPLFSTLVTSNTESNVGDKNEANRAASDASEHTNEEKRTALGNDALGTQDDAYDTALSEVGQIFASSAMRLDPLSVLTFLRHCIHLLQPLAADELMQTLGTVVRRSVAEWSATDMGELVWAFFADSLSPGDFYVDTATAEITGIAFRAFCRASGLSTGLFECSCLDVLEAIALQCDKGNDETTVRKQSAKLAFVAAFLQPSAALTPETVVSMCAEFLSSDEVEHIAAGFGNLVPDAA
eukprot:6176887-Pleurochrysis_carterae.AAC.2